MPLESHHSVIQRYFNHLINSVREPSEALHDGYYSDMNEDEMITEIHQLENSKASQMVNLNIKHRA